MSALDIHPRLAESMGEAIRWLWTHHLPVPYDFEISGKAPNASRKVDLPTLHRAIKAGAEFVVTNDACLAIRDFGPLRLCLSCRRWDCRSVPPSDRAKTVIA